MDLPVIAAVVAAMLIVPALAALVLRSARAPGAAVIGGALAGLLLGPGVLGRVFPHLYEHAFIGGVQERQAADRIARQRGAYLVAADAGHIDAAGRKETLEQFANQEEHARAAWEAATWSHQQPLRVLTLIIVAAVLVGAGLRAPTGPVRAELPSTGASLIHAASIGLSAATFPGVLAYLAARVWDCSAPVAALTGAAVAIGPWMLTAVDRQAADEAEIGGARLMEVAGRIASLAAISVAAGAMWWLRGWTGLLDVLPMGAIFIGWIMRPRGVGIGEGAGAKWSIATVDHVLIPALAACVAVKIEPFHHAALWPILVLVLLSGDGRWLGALCGALLPGGRGGVRTFRTMRLVLGAMAAGPTQLAIAAIALHTRTLPESIGFGLLVGAVVVEATAPLRRSMAQRLLATEEEVGEA